MFRMGGRDYGLKRAFGLQPWAPLPKAKRFRARGASTSVVTSSKRLAPPTHAEARMSDSPILLRQPQPGICTRSGIADHEAACESHRLLHQVTSHNLGIDTGRLDS